MGINALDWYKKKIEEISSHGGYIRNTIINVQDEYGTHAEMELNWLFDNYSPQYQEILYTNDKIKFTKDGTPLHEIAIFLKEIPKI